MMDEDELRLGRRRLFQALITVGPSATRGTSWRPSPRGASLSAHSISRLSPVWHKEGDHVHELKVVLPGGHLRTLRRDAAAARSSDHDLFLEAIVEVIYELLRVAPAGAQAQVATQSTLFRAGDHGLWADLLTTLQQRAVDNEIVLSRAVTTASMPAPADTEPVPPVATAPAQRTERVVTIIPEPASTVYASFWWGAGSDKPEKALLAESRYVFDRELSPMILYDPENEVMGEIENLMMGCSWVNRTIQDLATRLFASGPVAVTPIAGFTFFRDANLLVREREYTGPRSVVLQQTFILPDPERGSRFLNDLTASVRGDAELPTLCDVLWLPRDANPFCLSATAESGGFAVTLTYLRPDDSRRVKIQHELRALRRSAQTVASTPRRGRPRETYAGYFERGRPLDRGAQQVCADLLTARCRANGVRIRLVKSVEVGSQADPEATHGAQLAYFRALKARYDPHNQRVNRFYERVPGPVAAPVAARAARREGGRST